MTKQEKIRKDAVGICEKFGLNWNEATYLTDYLFTYLHENGVVLKIDRDVPIVEFTLTGNMVPSEVGKIGSAYRKAYANYVAVEPLVEK